MIQSCFLLNFSNLKININTQFYQMEESKLQPTAKNIKNNT